MLSVLIMLALVSVLIIAHELGHFFVAKKCGVRVERFGFGLPIGPTLWSRRFGDTEYCLHPFLFGGYVAFPDDNPDSPIAKDSPQRFENQSVANRFAIAVAGVTVNALLGWGLMAAVILFWPQPVIEGADVSILKTLSADSPAAQAGILPGDKVLAVAGKPVAPLDAEDRLSFVSGTIHKFAGKPMTFTVERKGKPMTLQVTPDAKGIIGIQLQLGEVRYVQESNPLVAGQKAYHFLANVIVMNFDALGKMFAGQGDPRQLSGPIQLVNVGSRIIEKNGIQEGLKLTAIISVILAVMNLLPIPALDGGHILFLAIEAVKGSPVRKEIQERFVQAGFVGLLLLMGFVLWNDINNVFIDPVKLPF